MKYLHPSANKFRSGVAACLALLLAGCATDYLTVNSRSHTSRSFNPREVEGAKVAVVDFAGQGGQAIADIMTMMLFKNGYEVVERDRVVTLVNELQIAMDGYQNLSDAELASKLGKMLNADIIFTGDVFKILSPRCVYSSWKGRFTFPFALMGIAARAIDVKTGEIIWISNVKVVANAYNGRYLKPIDYIKDACSELIYNFKNGGNGFANTTYEDDEIDEEFRARFARRR